MLKLNIGCGNLPLPDYKNIDISKNAKADECYDASKGIREEDNSVDEINCGCMMEQISDNKNFIKFLNECNRVLKKGGVLKGYVPSTDPRVMFLDPMDRRFFQLDSFNYFNKHTHYWQEFGRMYGFKGWDDTGAVMNENGIIHFLLKK